MSYMNDFMFPNAETYLNTGSEGLVLKSSHDALQSYWADKQRGSLGRTGFYAIEQQCRSAVARLLNVPSETVGFTSSASEGLNLLANSLDWKPGDQVLFTDLEHPTNVLPWLRLRRLGVVPVLISSRDGKISREDIIARITSKTKLVTVSLVSYKNGLRLTFLSDLARAVHDAGSLLCVDATQAVGRVATEVRDADFMVASGYKWLCGIHGLGIIYARPDFLREFHPGSLGWYSVTNMFAPNRFDSYTLKPSASCLQCGMPNFPAMYALTASINYLNDIGIKKLEKSLLPLMHRLYQGLVGLNLHMLTPPQEDLWSGMVAFSSPSAEAIGQALTKKGVIIWCGDGRVRGSVHLYNDNEDVEIFLKTLRHVLGA